MSKLLALLLTILCLDLNALTVLPASLPKFRDTQASLQSLRFSPIVLDTAPAKLLATRVKLTEVKQSYELLSSLYIAYVANKVLLEQIRLLLAQAASQRLLTLASSVPEPRATIQSVSSASHSTGSSSSRSSSRGSGSTGSGDSDSTISSHGSRLLSPSSDSDNRN